jgi:CRP/FNR family nitrogen fixation transcriptional regulator
VGAESVTPVVLYEFDIATTERLAQSNAEISAFLLEMLSQRAAAREEHTLFLSCLSALERLAGFLLSLWERSGRRARVKVPIGRGDVADYLGMRPETLSRSLSRLRSMQVVECISPDEIMILSPLRLKAVVGQGRRLQASGSQAQHTDTMAED